MNSGTLLMVSGYTILLISIFYFCFIADPKSNPITKFVVQTLPNDMLWNKIGSIPVVGEGLRRGIDFVSERFLAIVYLAIICGGWTVLYWYCYPWGYELAKAGHISYIHFYNGYVLFWACLYSWKVTHETSPGIITAKTMAAFDHYPYDNLLFLSTAEPCPTTGLRKLPRSKFDRIKYQQHVPRFDHYCGWVHNSIGEQNYRFFLLFLLTHVFICWYGSYLVGSCLSLEIKQKELFEVVFFDKITGDEFTATYWIVFQYMFHTFFHQVSMFIVMFVMAITLTAFFIYHVRITSLGKTTNEDFKWGQISRWYKKQKAAYEQAVKDGKVSPANTNPGNNNNNSLDDNNNNDNNDTIRLNDDKDVTCTPPILSVAQQDELDDDDDNTKHEDDIIFDPGPYPKNLYDRGFVENWKEVIFPRSLRKENLEKIRIQKTSSLPQSTISKKKKAKKGKQQQKLQ